MKLDQYHGNQLAKKENKHSHTLRREIATLLTYTTYLLCRNLHAVQFARQLHQPVPTWWAFKNKFGFNREGATVTADERLKKQQKRKRKLRIARSSSSSGKIQPISLQQIQGMERINQTKPGDPGEPRFHNLHQKQPEGRKTTGKSVPERWILTYPLEDQQSKQANRRKNIT